MTQYTQQAQLFNSKFTSGNGGELLIADLEYWVANQAEISLWMNENLDLEYSGGPAIWFNNERQRLMFLLRWG